MQRPKTRVRRRPSPARVRSGTKGCDGRLRCTEAMAAATDEDYLSAEDEDYVPGADPGEESEGDAEEDARQSELRALAEQTAAREIQLRVQAHDKTWDAINSSWESVVHGTVAQAAQRRFRKRQREGKPVVLGSCPPSQTTRDETRWLLTKRLKGVRLSAEIRARTKLALRKGADAVTALSSSILDGIPGKLEPVTAARIELAPVTVETCVPGPVCRLTARFLRDSARPSSDVTRNPPSHGRRTRRLRREPRGVVSQSALTSARAALELFPDVSSSLPAGRQEVVVVERGGVLEAAAALEDTQRQSTLAISSADWERKKATEGFRDDVERFAKDGFVARQEFLERVNEGEAARASETREMGVRARRARAQKEHDRTLRAAGVMPDQ
jgi:hypothetical protein